MKKIVLALLCLSSFTTFSRAQDSLTISLDEAIDIALKNNFQLKVAKNRVELADDRIMGEKTDYFPSLNASINANRSISNQFVPGTNTFVTGAVDNLAGSLSSSIVLFNGFSNIRSLRNAKYLKKTQMQNVQWTKETIIFETATRFLQVLLNRELLEIAKENLKASLKTLEQVKIQTEVGARPIVDLYNQKASVANNQLEVTNRQNAFELSKLKLIRALQVDPLEKYEFVIPEIELEQITSRDYELPRLVAVALENRSDLQSEKYNIQALKWQLKATKSRYYPTLNFSASIGSGYSPSFINRATGRTSSFTDQFFDLRVNKGFGLSLSIPIFNNFNVRTSVQVAKINYKNAKLQLQDTRLQVVQEVKQAYSDYLAVLERLQSTKVVLKAAKKAYKAEQARYEVGAGTLIQLTRASANLVEAKANRTQAVFNFIFQKKLLDYYLGKLDSNISFN